MHHGEVTLLVTLFMTGPSDYKRLAHSFEEATVFYFPWDLRHFLFALDIIKCVFLLEGKYGLTFYQMPELLIIRVSFLTIL